MSCPVLPPQRHYRRRVATWDVVLLHWLTFGVFSLMVLPVAQWQNHWVGWLPFWLILLPACGLARHFLPMPHANPAHTSH